MKTLSDIKQDMDDLYESVKGRATDLKTADTLANVAGKHLKAEQLELAREIFTSGLQQKIEDQTKVINGD